jgi:hypothetical protein
MASQRRHGIKESSRLCEMFSVSGAAHDTREAEGAGEVANAAEPTCRRTDQIRFVLESLMIELASGPGKKHTTIAGVYETRTSGPDPSHE